MLDLLRDLKFAVRGLVRAPGFALIAVLTIGVGTGMTTAIFSVVNGVLLRPLSLPDSDRIVTLWGYRSVDDFEDVPLTPADFVLLDDGATSFDNVGAGWSNSATLTGEPGAEEVRVLWVTADYFSILGVEPGLGSDFEEGGEQDVILSHGLWRRRFGGDSTVVGNTLHVGGTPMTVRGVLPPDVNANLPSRGGVRPVNDLYRVMPAGWISADDRSIGWLRVFARLADGVALDQARAELVAVSARIREVADEDTYRGFELRATTVKESLVRRARPMLLMLFGAVGLVLLISCANVAGLLLVRGQSRVAEMSVRAALGGGRGRLLRQLLTESGVLGLAGSAVGIVLAFVAVAGLAAARPEQLPRVEAVRVDGVVLAFAIGTALAAAAVFGLVPAWRLARRDLADALRERAGTAGRKQMSMGRLLASGEVALSLILLAGAGLHLRSFLALQAIDPGFDTTKALTFSINLPSHLDGDEAVLTFVRQLEQSLASIPGVTDVGLSNRIPLGGGLFTAGHATDEMLAASLPERESDIRLVSPGFIGAMGGRLLRGRVFSSLDEPGVALIDSKLASEAWPGQDPIGKRVRTDVMGPEKMWFEVIGVVQHMRHEQLEADGRPTIFLPADRAVGPGRSVNVVMRTTGQSGNLTTPARNAIVALDPDVPMSKITTVEGLVDSASASTRFALFLIGGFAVVALGLSVVGMAGVISYGVAQREREFGVRLAFGATSGAIIRLVVGDGLRVIGVGVAVGLAGAWAVNRVFERLLFGVAAMDPLTLFAVGLILLGSGLLATYLPARRATAFSSSRALQAN